MEIAIRVDASNRIGTGHVVRCLTLADELSTRGARCYFIHRCHPGNMKDAIRARGYEVLELNEPETKTELPAEGQSYVTWLGVSLNTDADETRAALANRRPDWLIVDHYALDYQWEKLIRPYVGRIAVIDDLANRIHDADFLVDQNYSVETESRYQDLLPENARLLYGPKYAMLNPAYADHRRQKKQHSGTVKRILVFLGGSDPGNLSGVALEALNTPELKDLVVDLVIGANNPHQDTLEDLASKRGNTFLYGPRSHLADLMASADFAIGAGGTTTWERCCLGLPSLVISIAENQRLICEALAKDGVIVYAGHWDSMNVEKLQEILCPLILNKEALRNMAYAGRSIVNGQGVGYVAEELIPSNE